MVLKTFLATHILLFQTFANSDAETVWGAHFVKTFQRFLQNPQVTCVSAVVQTCPGPLCTPLCQHFLFSGHKECQNVPE